ncbi:hypothetical protein [Lentzea waywayandensis]|uniref:hypothetical protein n=1 Tax=Lentzea waywayandensis TaxID=84724 RepID=UPI0015A67FD5|nr:hypothetical protein [Lentzea waywayandensis]
MIVRLGDPSVELLRLVATMLAKMHRVCAPPDGPGATVMALPTVGRTPSSEA